VSAPKLTAVQRRHVRAMMEDEGATRAEAVAWVRAFEPAVVAAGTEPGCRAREATK
jgi:hypothetical protein